MSDNKIRTITKDGITYDIEDSRVAQNIEDIADLQEQTNNLTNDLADTTATANEAAQGVANHTTSINNINNAIHTINENITDLDERVTVLETTPSGNRIYNAEYDMDVLPSSFIEQLKAGDIIYCQPDSYAYIVSHKDENATSILQIAGDSLDRYNVYYDYNNDMWNFDYDENLTAGGSGGALYQHTIRIDAWDDTEPDGMGYDWVTFIITTSSSTPLTLSTFKQQANHLPLIGATVLNYFCGGEDSSYYGGTIRELYINSSNQNIIMTIDMYNYDGVTPSINASWTRLNDDVIQL